MTLTEFLLARITEDEEAARAVIDNEPSLYRSVMKINDAAPLPPPDVRHIARHDPARVLAECEAKRRIVDLALEDAATIDREWGWLPGYCTGPAAAVPYLATLALPYADHTDYREEWRPWATTR